MDSKSEVKTKLIGTLVCLLCGKKIPSVSSGSHNAPSGGIVFRATGNSGSEVFDPEDGRFLEINIHDDCIKLSAARQRVALGILGTSELQVWFPPAAEEEALAEA